MSNTWKAGAYSSNSTAVSMDDEELLREKVVILLQGKNVYGDQIFTYLELSLKSLIQLRSKMQKQEEFLPAEYGEVLAAGKGDPSPELRSEMAITHNMIDVPRPRAPSPAAIATAPPKLWDD